MAEDRNTVVVSEDDLLAIVRVLNMLTLSLDRIGSCDVVPDVREKLHMAFLCEWRILRLVAKCRGILFSYFSDELGPDEMDDLERMLKDEPHWTLDNRKPPIEWLRGLLDRPNES